MAVRTRLDQSCQWLIEHDFRKQMAASSAGTYICVSTFQILIGLARYKPVKTPFTLVHYVIYYTRGVVSMYQPLDHTPRAVMTRNGALTSIYGVFNTGR